MLPLEKWLKARCDEESEYKTSDGQSFFDAYTAQKSKLKTHVYPFVANGLISFKHDKSSTSLVEVYTDHGWPHVEALIKAMGAFLGCHNENSKIMLNAYEVFLLLMAALAHDAGNIYGREHHNRQVFPLLTDANLKVLSTLEISKVADIAKAHTGKGLISGRETKDTLSTLHENLAADLSGTEYNPRQLAAILRFCDEICEKADRAPSLLLNRPEVATGPSSRYLHYSKSIGDVKISYAHKCIEIWYHVNEDQLVNKIRASHYDGSPDHYYLIDEILNRIRKIKSEMEYCFYYIKDAYLYKSITAKIRSYHLDDLGDMIFTERALIDLSGRGYPDPGRLFDETLKQHSGKLLRKIVASERRR